MGVAMSVDTSAETVRTLIGTIQASSIHGPRWREQVRALEVAAAALLTERDEAIRQREAAEQVVKRLAPIAAQTRAFAHAADSEKAEAKIWRTRAEAAEARAAMAEEQRAATLEVRVKELEAGA